MTNPDRPNQATRKSPQRTESETAAPNQTGAWQSAGTSAGATPAVSKIGRFKVRKLLGEGAFARVYLGFDPELEREVAIKVPKVEELTPDTQEAFLRENRLAAIINHPNICPIYDVGTDNGVPYIVMRVVTDNLASVLKRLSAPMPPRNAVAITRKLALGLAAAHAQKVIHRDLKPANILYDSVNREVLIADFGLARLVDRASESSNGVPKGTPLYMAPEQARGENAAVGPHSDVYALGIILYEMLTGRVPFRGSVWEVMRDHCETLPAPPSTIRADLDKQLDSVCLKALAKNPADRFASAKEFAAALADYLRGGEHVELVPTPVPVLAAPPRLVPIPVPIAPATPAQAFDFDFATETTPTPPPDDQKSPPSVARGKPPRAEEKPVAPRRKMLLWVGVAISTLILGAFIVMLSTGVFNSAKPEPAAGAPQQKGNHNRPNAPPPTTPPRNSQEPVDLELQRDWSDYLGRTGMTNGNRAVRDFIQERGPTRWQAWKRAASANDLSAIVLYGRCLLEGVGIPQDQAEALRWFNKAAEQQSTAAMMELGFCHYFGKGVTKDTEQAVVWFRKAAAEGDARGMGWLGQCYFEGVGAPRDLAKAIEWFEKAGAKGHAPSQYMLGHLYRSGNGVPRNDAKAFEWYEKAAKQGDLFAQLMLAELYSTGQGVAQNPYQAFYWYEQAAKQGDSTAQFQLGEQHRTGLGTTVDIAKAREWYEKAAAQNHIAAQYQLGNMYYFGQGIPKDYVKAREWYEKAAQFDMGAQFNLGLIYYHGEGVKADFAMAKAWYEKAANRGYALAQNNLGSLYHKGEGAMRDYAKAKAWYEKAAAQNLAIAQYNLGLVYEYGLGVPKDLTRARDWYRKAADQGDAKAITALERLEKK